MKTTPKSRTEVRAEKRRSLQLVVLILVVAVSSFALGVFVGHRQAPSVVTEALSPRMPISVPEAAPVAVARPKTSPVEKVSAKEEPLSFYKGLPEEPSVLGSGMNPAPRQDSSAPLPRAETPPVQAEAPAAVAPATAPIAVTPSPSTQKLHPQPAGVNAQGRWILQLFSSRSAADAGMLRDRLIAKGYPARISEADLGARGIWFRVITGPYAQKETARQLAQTLLEQEKIKGLVRRR